MSVIRSHAHDCHISRLPYCSGGAPLTRNLTDWMSSSFRYFSKSSAQEPSAHLTHSLTQQSICRDTKSVHILMTQNAKVCAQRSQLALARLRLDAVHGLQTLKLSCESIVYYSPCCRRYSAGCLPLHLLLLLDPLRSVLLITDGSWYASLYIKISPCVNIISTSEYFVPWLQQKAPFGLVHMRHMHPYWFQYRHSISEILQQAIYSVVARAQQLILQYYKAINNNSCAKICAYMFMFRSLCLHGAISFTPVFSTSANSALPFPSWNLLTNGHNWTSLVGRPVIACVKNCKNKLINTT